MATRSKSSSLLDKFENLYVEPRYGRTLIVGSHLYSGKEDRRKRYVDSLGIDMIDGPGVDMVLDLEHDLPNSLGIFSHIECMSVLEHSRRPWLLAANLERLLEPGGTLFMAVPFIWRPHSYPSDYFRFTIHGLKSLFSEIKWDCLRYASLGLTKDDKMVAMNIDGHPFMARTEVLAFGHKPMLIDDTTLDACIWSNA